MRVDFAGRPPSAVMRGRRIRRGPVRRFLAVVVAGITLCGAAPAEQISGTVSQTMLPAEAGGPVGPYATPVQYQLERPSVSGQVDAVHSPNVDRLLKPQYKLELERRHSQLVMTNRRVSRIAVTDTSIVNYVQYSPTELSVVGLDLGRTDLTLWFDGEEVPAIYEITVVRDESLEQQRTVDFGRLERRMTALFPNSRVYLIPVGNQVIVQGQAYDAEEAQHILQIVRSEVMRSVGQLANDDNGAGYGQLGLTGLAGAGGMNGPGNQLGQQGFRDIVVNRLSVPGEFNIKMRVVIAELNRSQLRDMGFDWGVVFNDARHAVAGTLGGAPANLSGIFENGEISVFLRWLNSNGSITLLAEPTLVTMSGHTASILGGGEFAVPTTIGLGGGQTTTFRGFGTSLLVTPTVVDRDLIRLQVVPEFSEVNSDNAVNGIPGTNVKRVQTTVELREGQTFAIGGIISRQTLTRVSRVPLLGDIPYVGSRLFHSKTASEIETEMLVLVSPEIVRPMEPDEVPPLPNYYVTHPNDHDLFKYGRSEGNPDTNIYQVPPFGTGSTHGIPQGYSLFNPPVNHGGYVTGPSVEGGLQDPGYSGSLPSYGAPSAYGVPSAQGYPMVPQPDNHVPYSGGSRTYAAPPAQGQPWSGTPDSQYHVAPPATAPAAGSPQPMQPATPLPPIPQGYPAQGSAQPKVGGERTSLASRVGSVFRRDNASSSARPEVRTAGWKK